MTLTPPLPLRERTIREFPWGRSALSLVRAPNGVWLLGRANTYVAVNYDEVGPLCDFFSTLPHGAWERYLRGESLEAIVAEEAAVKRSREPLPAGLLDDIELELG